MDNQAKTARVLIVGDQASISRAGLVAGEECEVELVGSLAEAVERQASGDYARVIVDPDALGDPALEILASPVGPRLVGGPQECEATDEALRRLSQFPEEDPNPVIRASRDGALMYHNPPARQWLAALGWQGEGPLPAPVRTVVADACGPNRVAETEISSPSGSVSWVLATQPPGESYANLYIVDITDRKRSESSQRLAAETLRALNRAEVEGDLHTTIGELLHLIRAEIGCDAVGLRLRSGDDYPYFEQNGFSSEFVQEENSLCARGEDASIIRGGDGRVIIECTCGLVLSGQTDPSMPCFTPGGSFWTNRSSDLLELAPEDDPRTNPRNRCIHAGYQSVALIPVRSGGETMGLLQLNDRREGQFTPEQIRSLEGLAESIGLALRRKRAEEALRESQERVRRKLDSILSPEGDMGDLELADIIDAPAIQSLIDSFYRLAPIPMSIIDLNNRLLVGAGWQDICMKFHRVHPETCRHCHESDSQLSAGVQPGEFRLYRCKNGMWDVATPIVIGGEHVGNLFSGQFFFDDEQPDYEFFRSQAKRYGFDEGDYIAALDNVPRLSRQALNEGMSFYTKLAGMLSRLSYGNIKLARSLSERDALTESLREGEQRLKRAQEIAHLGSWELDLTSNELTWSDEVYRIFGLQPQEFGASYEAFLEHVHPDDRVAVDEAYSGSLREGRDTYEIEHRVVRTCDEEVRIVHERCEHIRDESGRITRSIGMVHDITERKLAEQQQQEILERERHIAEVLQSAILPREVPGIVHGYQFAVRYRPALREAEIGGDFYDVFDIGDGKIGILVGDVAGKGLAAAIRVSAARYAVRSYAYLDPRPSQVMARANDALCRDNVDEANVLTAFFAVLDTQAGSLSYTCAGHEPPIVRCNEDGCDQLEVGGVPMGILGGFVYPQGARRIDPGDVLVVVTDGITEARAPGTVLFGMERLVELVAESRGTTPDELASRILDAATAHAGGQLQDDAAIVVLSALPLDEQQ